MKGRKEKKGGEFDTTHRRRQNGGEKQGRTNSADHPNALEAACWQIDQRLLGLGSDRKSWFEKAPGVGLPDRPIKVEAGGRSTKGSQAWDQTKTLDSKKLVAVLQTIHTRWRQRGRSTKCSHFGISFQTRLVVFRVSACRGEADQCDQTIQPGGIRHLMNRQLRQGLLCEKRDTLLRPQPPCSMRTQSRQGEPSRWKVRCT